ncbi:hypothetical protein AB0M95_17995 [Sphaerisporangium sp. NPDC051017]|uniref:hypothetical protein n=1 Tax=Sphaerisporangium sp. NPDC051017 TaxID=3154636 RepID=UPI003442BE18
MERRLTELEHDVLGYLLSVEFPGVRELRHQLQGACVTGTWSSSGRSPSIYIKVGDNLPVAPILGEIAPVRAIVRSEDGEPVGELILWLTDGKLSALEYAWVTDRMPSQLPHVKAIELSVAD